MKHFNRLWAFILWISLEWSIMCDENTLRNKKKWRSSCHLAPGVVHDCAILAGSICDLHTTFHIHHSLSIIWEPLDVLNISLWACLRFKENLLLHEIQQANEHNLWKEVGCRGNMPGGSHFQVCFPVSAPQSSSHRYTVVLLEFIPLQVKKSLVERAH